MQLGLQSNIAVTVVNVNVSTDVLHIYIFRSSINPQRAGYRTPAKVMRIKVELALEFRHLQVSPAGGDVYLPGNVGEVEVSKITAGDDQRAANVLDVGISDAAIRGEISINVFSSDVLSSDVRRSVSIVYICGMTA